MNTRLHEPEVRHVLFLIAELRQDKIAQPACVEYDNYSEADKTGVYEKRFIDHLDLDDDGIDEFFIMATFYGGYQYEIYKRTNHRWQSIFRGGGGGY
jgi:hypothetical protein